MASYAFAARLDFLSNDKIKQPPIAKTTSHPPSNEELDRIQLPSYGLFGDSAGIIELQPISNSAAASHISAGSETPKIADDAEDIRPPSPHFEEATGVVPSWHYPRMNKWRHLAACLEYFGNGLNDSAPGALLPYIESWYHIGYAVVSLIWVSNAVGFIVAAFCAEFLDSKLGRARALMLSELCMIAAYTVIACPVPFPAVVVAYLLQGFGNAVNIALNNVFCSNLANSTVILGAAHGSYGVGGILGPIVATAIVSNGVSWHFFYLVPLGIRVLCLAFVGVAFWNYEKEEITRFGNSLIEVSSRQTTAEVGPKKRFRSVIKALRSRVTIIGALFIFAYQGVEVSESGWFISYLIAYRKADPARVGYVTSGFWAGITVGRFVLTHFARRVGEKRFVFGLVSGVIVFQLLAWFVPDVVGDSVAVSILGLLIGPVYPCAQTIFTRLLPGNVQVFAIGFISSAGSSGGAVVPFLTGLLAQAAGTFVLHPVCIAFTVVMLACWAGLPKLVKRTE